MGEEKDSRENDASSIDYNTGESSAGFNTYYSGFGSKTDDSILGTDTGEGTGSEANTNNDNLSFDSNISNFIKKEDNNKQNRKQQDYDELDELMNAVVVGKEISFLTASNEKNKSKSGLKKPSEETPEKEKPTRRKTI